MNPTLRPAAALALTLALCGAARADTATLTVTATVSPACELVTESATLAFGDYSMQTQAEVLSTATLTINCSPSTVLAVAGSLGQNASGAQRRMKSSEGNFLLYGLFADAPRTQPITQAPTAVTLNGNAATIYGKVFANQTVPAGQYQDSVVLEFIF